MSTDWDKYSTPQETQQQARTPTDNGVISLPVGPVRLEAAQQVEHTPLVVTAPDPSRSWLRSNRAHTDVIGKKDNEVRLKLRRMCRVELLPDAR